jgi:hypothetical protein
MSDYLIDDLRDARKKLRALKQSGTATPEQIREAESNLLSAEDSYNCSLGFDN